MVPAIKGVVSLNVSTAISNSSDIMRPGLSAIGSRQPKIGKHTSAKSYGV